MTAPELTHSECMQHLRVLNDIQLITRLTAQERQQADLAVKRLLELTDKYFALLQDRQAKEPLLCETAAKLMHEKSES